MNHFPYFHSLKIHGKEKIEKNEKYTKKIKPKKRRNKEGNDSLWTEETHLERGKNLK